MDSSGVPKKINRHVLKALITVLEEGLKFTEVLEYVRLCNKKLKPVPNIKHVVLKSLANFQKIGLITRDRKCRYKITNLVIPRSATSSGKVTKRASGEAAKSSFLLDPNSRRRSNESSDEENVENARKRFRSQKDIGNREGTKVNLPNSRKQNIALIFPKSGNLCASNMLSGGNFDEDLSSMGASDDKDNEFNDDESMKALSDEERGEAGENTEPAEDTKPDPVTEDTMMDENTEDTMNDENTEYTINDENTEDTNNDENSGETNTPVPNETENLDQLKFNYESYLN